jgi:3-oxoacyl-[acyl-carrier protein] reductase
MELGLKGRVALVNGASQGIGYGIARMLAAEGARVVVAARREPALREAAERLRRETSAEIEPVQGDIRRADDCQRLIATTIKRFGTLQILVNNDGAPPLGRLIDFDDEAWAKAVDQNLMSVVRLVRAAVPHMRTAGGGSILNIAALSMLQPMADFGLSVATWAAVMGFAKTASIEFGPEGITVNTICPGLIETPRLHKVIAQSSEGMRNVEAHTPMRRVGTIDDLAALAVLLVSPRGSYITGTTIQVDGGALRSLR